MEAVEEKKVKVSEMSRDQRASLDKVQEAIMEILKKYGNPEKVKRLVAEH